jgi:nucleoside-diphosphate-sugar epimerase
MKAFVTGATGVLGRGVVEALTAAGHSVRGVARSDEKAAWLRAHGAEPVAVDLYDAAAVKDALAGADTVLHLATSIPPMSRMRKAAAWVDNNRLRTDTTRHLVDAALAHGASTFVAESITFLYDDRGDGWITEDDHFADDGWLHSVVDLEREVARFTDAGGKGTVLRFGAFYGPEARSTDEMLNLAKRGVAPYLGAPDAFLSSIHTDDAASATVAALAAPAGTYNVVDEPRRRREVADAFADAFGLRRQHFVPGAVAKLATRKTGDALLRSQRVSNRRFRDAAGWVPRYGDAREGWHAVARARAQEVRDV